MTGRGGELGHLHVSDDLVEVRALRELLRKLSGSFLFPEEFCRLNSGVRKVGGDAGAGGNHLFTEYGEVLYEIRVVQDALHLDKNADAAGRTQHALYEHQSDPFSQPQFGAGYGFREDEE